MAQPFMVELYAGLHGWGAPAAAEGWRVIGFDIVDMCREIGEPRPDGDIQLVLQNVLTLHGRQFKDADLIVGSSPCQEFSYRAMPWKLAKALGPPELGMALFNAQFLNSTAEQRLRDGSKNTGGSWFNVVHNTTSGKGNNPDGRVVSHHFDEADGGGTKIHLSGRAWYAQGLGRVSSASASRKAASAKIAKIPLPLALHIARTFRP